MYVTLVVQASQYREGKEVNVWTSLGLKCKV